MVKVKLIIATQKNSLLKKIFGDLEEEKSKIEATLTRSHRNSASKLIQDLKDLKIPDKNANSVLRRLKNPRDRSYSSSSEVRSSDDFR